MLRALDGGWRITSMPLYVDVHRINNELAELGIGPDEPLTPDQLFPFDQFHYHGVDAVRAAAGIVGLGRGSRVLEVGSGLGGAARYLAHTVGCHVTALELQEELHELARTLTRRCRLDTHVTHVRGDALTYPFPDGGFDAAVSWLALHHIPRRPRLAARLAQAIRPGGRMYIEDLVVRAPFAKRDAEAVRHALYGVTMTGVREYEADLHGAGFVELETTDMTGSWAAFCQGRAAAFTRGRDREVRIHGAATAERLEAFFSTVARLFASGSLGGIRIVARRA
ncbi:MAG TPA: methyltransferase domain-containing protein [Vicinamibacterales bacterium]